MPISTLQSGSFPSNVAIDTDTLVVDGANNRVGINQAAPAHPVHVGTDDLIVDASGNLLVGKTTSNYTTDGLEFRSDGQIFSSVDGNYTSYLNRKNSDGDILIFAKDAATVGSIGSASSGGVFDISGAANDVRITGGNASYWLDNSAVYAGNNASRDLGTSSFAWRDLYLSGGVFLGGVGSANYLDDYEEGSWTPQLWKGSTQVTSPTAVYGLYRKIGSVFLVSFYFYKSSGSNTDNYEWQIRGFPFAIVSSSSAAYMSLAAGYTGINSTNYFNQAGSHRWQANGTTFLSLYGPQSTTQWTSGHIELAASGFLVTS